MRDESFEREDPAGIARGGGGALTHPPPDVLPVLAITAPIYLLIALGHVAVRAGWVRPPELRVLGGFVMRFSLPALLFDALSQRRFADVWSTPFVVAYAAAALLVLGLGVAWGRRRGAPASLAAMMGLGAASSNTAYIGHPLATALVGPSAAVALALAMLVENLLIIPLGLALADAGTGRAARAAFVDALRALPRNPMIVAIAAGVAVAVVGVPLPEPLVRAVRLVAAAASPVALFVIGGSLVGLRVAGMRADLAAVAAGKLIVHPLAVAGALALLPPIEPRLRDGAIVLASVSMMGIYPVLAQRYGHEGFCAAALLVATVASFATLGLVLPALHAVPALR